MEFVHYESIMFLDSEAPGWKDSPGTNALAYFGFFVSHKEKTLSQLCYQGRHHDFFGGVGAVVQVVGGHVGRSHLGPEFEEPRHVEQEGADHDGHGVHQVVVLAEVARLEGKVDTSGLFCKPMMTVNDDSRVVNKLETSLTDDARVVLYDRHMFMVQAIDCVFFRRRQGWLDSNP